MPTCRCRRCGGFAICWAEPCAADGRSPRTSTANPGRLAVSTVAARNQTRPVRSESERCSRVSCPRGPHDTAPPDTNVRPAEHLSPPRPAARGLHLHRQLELPVATAGLPELAPGRE